MCRNFENCGIENPGSEIRQGVGGGGGGGNEERTTKGSSGKPRDNNLEWWNLGFQIRGEFDHQEFYHTCYVQKICFAFVKELTLIITLLVTTRYLSMR